VIDFKLNDSGDIEFDTFCDYPKFQLKFTTGAYSSMQIRFSSDIVSRPIMSKGMHIQFYTTDMNLQHTIKANAIYDQEATIQAIKMWLDTELGEIADMDYYGSELIYQKHQDLISEDNLGTIQQIVSDIVSQFVTDTVTVIATAERNEDAKFFYGQNITVRLYASDGSLFYKFTI
jgi:hypothetical protein